MRCNIVKSKLQSFVVRLSSAVFRCRHAVGTLSALRVTHRVCAQVRVHRIDAAGFERVCAYAVACTHGVELIVRWSVPRLYVVLFEFSFEWSVLLQ